MASADSQYSKEAQERMFRQAKAYLMKADASGQNVYDQLHTAVLTMMEENPDDVAHHPEKFGQLFSSLKRHSFGGGAGTEDSGDGQAASLVHHTQAQRAEANMELFNRPKSEVVTVIERPTPNTTVTTTTVKPPSAPVFRSVVAQNQYWKFCGAGLPEKEAFLLDQSISTLARTKSLSEVRFFGKIFGLRGNYLIVSSKRYVEEKEEVFEEVNTMPKPARKKLEVDTQPEPGYKGCNRLSFWVASHAAGEWTLLPDTTPQEVNAVRKFRKMFTGDLNAKIVSYPHFDASEAVYLRAQLSRIISATYVSPNNALEKVEPEDEEEEEEEEEDGAKKGPKLAKYFPLTTVNKEYAPENEEAGAAATLMDIEQWVHSEGYIYDTGRQTKVPPKPETEEEEEEDKEEEEEEEEELKEEEEKEMFLPLKKDYLHAVIDIPKEPNPEEDEDEEPEAEEENPEGEEEKEEEEENKPLEDEEIPDDDPLKKKVASWIPRAANTHYKRHSVVALRCLRWPGALAYASQGGKQWGCVYFGNGIKKTDQAFTPIPAPPIMKEAADMTEVMDPTAATEKLVLRGEEPKENDSEDEKEEDDEEQEEGDE